MFLATLTHGHHFDMSIFLDDVQIKKYSKSVRIIYIWHSWIQLSYVITLMTIYIIIKVGVT